MKIVMASLLQQPTSWRSLLIAEESVSEADLEAMGFDVRRLGFYAWLVAQGREPEVHASDRLSVPHYGEALVS